MLRIALILTTILATTLGSLGLPIALHTCRMIVAETEAAGCAMCASRDDEEASRPIVPANDDDDGSCCGSSVVHQRVDSGTSYRADLPMPLFSGVVAYLLLEIDAPSTVASHERDFGDSPPGLAARRQHTYLLNASFLI